MRERVETASEQRKNFFKKVAFLTPAVNAFGCKKLDFIVRFHSIFKSLTFISISKKTKQKESLEVPNTEAHDCKNRPGTTHALRQRKNVSCRIGGWQFTKKKFVSPATGFFGLRIAGVRLPARPDDRSIRFL
jgi:hypothetical protein